MKTAYQAPVKTILQDARSPDWSLWWRHEISHLNKHLSTLSPLWLKHPPWSEWNLLTWSAEESMPRHMLGEQRCFHHMKTLSWRHFTCEFLSHIPCRIIAPLFTEGRFCCQSCLEQYCDFSWSDVVLNWVVPQPQLSSTTKFSKANNLALKQNVTRRIYYDSYWSDLLVFPRCQKKPQHCNLVERRNPNSDFQIRD